MLIHSKSVLSLIQNGLVGSTMNVFVLAATDFVAEGLASGLLRVWSGATVKC